LRASGTSGTFYRSPAPGAALFVEVGQEVKASDIVCMVEVMKLLSSIRAGMDGTIAEIVARNEEPAIAGAPMISLSPAPRSGESG
jgi:acetyl-CoA carboxylase biotin carboxyl carrier protein